MSDEHVVVVHVDKTRYVMKPEKKLMAAIKVSMADEHTIDELTIKEIVEKVIAGISIQPGVCPLSDESRAKGKTGTCKEDFKSQSLFMSDIDNDKEALPLETPEHIAEVLAEHGLKSSFMYETFSSTADRIRFRFAVTCSEPITDRGERDRIQAALIALSPQADKSCTNADRIFLGTNKGLIESYSDLNAAFSKEKLLALADEVLGAQVTLAQAASGQKTQSLKEIVGDVIPQGSRNSTLNHAAGVLLKRFGNEDGKAYEMFLECTKKCNPPLGNDELIAIWNSAKGFYVNNVRTSPDYLSPAQYEATKNADKLEPNDYTDVGEARIFVNQYQEKCRYSSGTSFLVYDGKKWNESDLKAQGLAQELTDRQLAQARKMVRAAQDEINAAEEANDEEKLTIAHDKEKAAKSYRGFVLGCRKSGRISAMMTEARPSIEIDTKDLDADPFALNTPRGTVDLRTCTIRKHNPKDFCTKMTAVSPSEEGMDIWKDFLDRITCGDKELQEYHQVCSGMELVGKVFCENLIIAYGSGGNGKSTYYNAKFLCLGDYAGSLSAETLTVNCRKNKSPEYAELRGKRFVIAAELEEGMRLDTAIVKKLCSTDPILAEKKYKAPFTFIPSHTVTLFTNHLPKVGTNDKGTWDRLVVIPFPARLRGAGGEIKNYAEYLYEHCGGAILLWMIQGARKFIESNYFIEKPQIVKDAIEEYRQENDWLNNFVTECCEEVPGEKVKAGDMYEAYKAHCESINEYVRHIGDFKAAMIAAGFNWKKTNKGAFYFGLKLRNNGFVPFRGRSPFDDPKTELAG